MKKLTQKYVEEMIEDVSNGEITVIGIYSKNNKKLECKCNKCGKTWFPTYSNVVSHGSRCPRCNGGVLHNHSDFMRDVVNIHGDNIIVIGQYIKNTINIELKCNNCSHEWKTLPKSIRVGHGCPECGGTKLKTHKRFVSELNEIHNEEITPMSDYKNDSTKIDVICNICGYIFKIRPNSLLRGNGCANCAGNRKNTYSEIVERIYDIHGDRLKVLGSYKGYAYTIKMQCCICQNIYHPIVGNVLSGTGCPICNKKQSKGARRVEDYLINSNIEYVVEYTFSDLYHIGILKFDFYLPEYNVLIEYDGIQHFEPIDFFGGEEEFEVRKIRDKLKDNYVIENNIPLLRVKYDIPLDEVWDYLDIGLKDLL